MKLSSTIMAVLMIMCLVSSACAAPNTGSPTNTATTTQGYIPAPEGIHAHTATGASASTIVTTNSGTSNAVNTAVSNAVSFTSTPASGTCIDNTKKVAVYMPDISSSMFFEHITPNTGNIRVAYDPMTTAMLFEYNPDYLGDSNIGSKLNNYGILIVPTNEISSAAATAITNYINAGGSVWFLNDPSMTTTFGGSVQLTGILGSGVSSSIGSSTVSVVNTDDITKGLPASFVPVGTAAKTAEFRSLPAMSGTIAGLNYQVLMGTNSKAMLVKFENPSNGARVIYSNPDMFISGGTASYFNAATATKLFTQTKAWIFKFAQNPNGIEVTYPNSDKQLTVTSDDEECTSYDVKITPMIKAEIDLGLTPTAMNTFFIIPGPDMVGGSATTYGINYYAQYGDTHTLHPHQFDISGKWSEADWDNSAHTAATDVSYMNTLKGVINTAVGSSNYGFNSFRFPYTTYCANSMQSISDGGFLIDSSSGCDSPATGTVVDNTILLPKATLVNNAKTNTIECELPADFDINYATGTAFGNAYNAVSGQFKNVNFPANFIVSGHYQGMATNCGVSGWGVTSKTLTSGLTSILTTQKAANPNYATLNTISNYLSAVKTAKVTATYDGASTTTVTVVPTKAITAFTLKLSGTVNSVTCDGAALTVKTDSTTGAMYVTKDLTATTHTFVVTTTAPTQTKPTVSFTPVTQTINSGATASFVATVSGNPTPTCTWTFGDTGTASGTSVSHVYTNTGTSVVNYPVLVTATSSAGSATFPGTVTVNPATTNTAPTITFTPVNPTITSGASVNFVATISGNPTPTVSWSFGDGSATGSGTSVSHAFTNTGTGAITRTVTATAKNSVNSAVFTTNVIVNTAAAGGAPVASFTQSATSGPTAEVVTFTSTSSNNPTCTWNFGDGTGVATGNVVTHAFLSHSGSTAFTVTLTATNSVSSSTKTGTVTATAYVNPPSGAPAAWFTISPTSGTTATTFTFAPDCDNTPTSFVWDFRDGTTQTTTTQTAVTHKFTKAGSYDVVLVASNAKGKDYDDHIVTIT